MKVVVTGATGFLGRHVVEALSRGGHAVRAIVRPSSDTAFLEQWAGIEIFRANLRTHPNLRAGLEGADALVHLAAVMSGSDFARFAEIVTTTERLLGAMAQSSVKRLVLCSSFSVYDWLSAHGTVDERLPLLTNVYGCGGYSAAKVWQERLAERGAAQHGWQLTILRPGFIWGPGKECPPSAAGRSLGPLHLVFGPRRCPPFTHVENCAEAFRAALERPEAIGRSINVVDEEAVTAWRFMGEYLRSSGTPGIRIPIPLAILAPLTRFLGWIGSATLGSRAKLPSFFVPARFAQGYRPLRYSSTVLREALGSGLPVLSFEDALARTYPSSRPVGPTDQ